MSSRKFSRTEKILEAAAHLFARQGYHATSTREIARRAEVSENTLFRYFARKEELFWSALRSCTGMIAQSDSLSGIRAGDPPDAVLPKILEALTEMVCNRPEVLRLIAIAYVELQGKAEVHCRDLLSPFLSEFSEYLTKSIAKGEVLEVDPALLAASLMAMVLMHPQFMRLIGGDREPAIDVQGAANAYSKFWLNVLTPKISASPIQCL
jgi:AcrR family transcriptional regulator